MSDRPPRVLWFVPSKPDDISVGRRRLADHLVDEGFDVRLRGTTPRTVLASIREVLAGRYDLVVGTTRAGAIAGVATKVVGRTPLVVDHVDPIRQFAETNPHWLARLVEILEDVAFAASDHVLYVYDEEEPRIRRFASSHGQTDLGVDFARFATPTDEAVEVATRRLRDIPLRDDVAIYLGGLEPIYHVDELLAATERLEDWTLLVLGAGSLEHRVRRAAERLDNVEFLGTVPHDVVPGVLHHADVGISLVDDPHTLKLLEYAAAGLGVVQLAGRAEERFGEFVTYCEAEPASIAAAIRDASERETDVRSFASQFDWSDVARDYVLAISIAMGDGR